MQLACLDEFGGEKAVCAHSRETTIIQHIFGGQLQSQVMHLSGSPILGSLCEPFFHTPFLIDCTFEVESIDLLNLDMFKIVITVCVGMLPPSAMWPDIFFTLIFARSFMLCISVF